MIKLAPVQEGEVMTYPVPVNDFTFSTLTVAERKVDRKSPVVELLFCHSGQVAVKDGANCLSLKSGDACLVPAGVGYSIEGKGSMALIGCLTG